MTRLRVERGVILFFSISLLACASPPAIGGKAVFVNGVNEVRIVPEEDGVRNTHPVNLTPSQIGTLLHRVFYGEQRNVVHRLLSGDPVKARAFRDPEIRLIAEPLSRALAEARPDERVYFRLGRPAQAGGEEITAGWMLIRGETLHLDLNEVHDVVAPGPDISKYQREQPDVPQAPTPFTASFEPEEYLAGKASKGSWLAPDQLEELQIRYKDALSALPPFKVMTPSPDERSGAPLR